MVMLVYDVTNEQSFQNLGTWLDLGAPLRTLNPKPETLNPKP